MKALLGFAAAGAVIAAVLLFHGAGRSSSPLSVASAKASTAACQAIQGAKAHALPAGSDPTASLDSKTCVIDFGIPDGAKGPTGPAGAAGAAGAAGPAGPPGMSGLTYGKGIIKQTHNYPPSLAATATCPAGDKALGGGYKVDATVNGVAAAVSSSLNRIGPTPDGNGWTTVLNGVTPRKSHAVDRVRITLTTTAVCAKVAG